MPRKIQHTQLPKGAKIYLPDEAAQKRRVEAELWNVFRKWGYREIVTSTYEYFDVLAQGTDQALQERMFKMVDRESGRLLALRADVTPQIARIVASRMREEPKPLRLAYVTNVFRYDEPHVGRYREFHQAGVELVGLPNPEGDAELIAMTVESLQLDVGQAEFFRGLLEDLALDGGRSAELRSALGRKDLSALERIVAGLGAPAAAGELLLALPSLYGRADVLDRAERLVKNPRSEAALKNLAEVYRLLTVYGLAESVLLDLGEVSGFDYYSGVHFEAYVSGLGAPLAGGGRYDHMLARFGYDCPATGFAFEVGRILLAMESQGVVATLPGPFFFNTAFTADKTSALALSRRLRDMGATVARDILSRGLDDSLDYARHQRARRVIVIGESGGDASELRVLDLASATGERRLSVADVLADPARYFPETGSRR